jgi:hypothetical protein
MVRIWDSAGKLHQLRDSIYGTSVEPRRIFQWEGELKALRLEAGFGDVGDRPLEIRMEFTSFDDCWEPFLEGIGPAGVYALNLDSDKRERLRERLRKRLDGQLSLRARELGPLGE